MSDLVVKFARPLKSGEGTAAVVPVAGGYQVEVLKGSGPVDPAPPTDAALFKAAVQFCSAYAEGH